MDKYERFDKYFICSYYEFGRKVGVFSIDTPQEIRAEAQRMFDVVEYE